MKKKLLMAVCILGVASSLMACGGTGDDANNGENDSEVVVEESNKNEIENESTELSEYDYIIGKYNASNNFSLEITDVYTDAEEIRVKMSFGYQDPKTGEMVVVNEESGTDGYYFSKSPELGLTDEDMLVITFIVRNQQSKCNVRMELIGQEVFRIDLSTDEDTNDESGESEKIHVYGTAAISSCETHDTYGKIKEGTYSAVLDEYRTVTIEVQNVVDLGEGRQGFILYGLISDERNNDNGEKWISTSFSDNGDSYDKDLCLEQGMTYTIELSAFEVDKIGNQVGYSLFEGVLLVDENGTIRITGREWIDSFTSEPFDLIFQ